VKKPVEIGGSAKRPTGPALRGSRRNFPECSLPLPLVPDEPPEFQPPPHPLERAWVHPSELGLARGRIPTPPPPTPRNRRSRTVIAASGVAGAILFGAIAGIALSVDASPGNQARLGGRSALQVAFGGSAPEQSVVTIDAGPDAGRTRGSGVAMGDGLVITSGALLSDAPEVRVNGIAATIVTIDPLTDVAVLRTSLALPPALLATRGPNQAGDRIALMARSANADGVVLTNDAVATRNENFVAGLVHTDMPSPAGSVGAATVDNSGAVTGIVSGLRLRTAGALVIPIDVVRDVLSQLHQSGTVRHGWLGIAVAAGPAGPVVESVVSGGPADTAGIRNGDTISTIAGSPTPSSGALLAASRSLAPGSLVMIGVTRGPAELTIAIRVGAAPAPA